MELRWQIAMGFIGLLLLFALVYASLVPLKYQAISWEDAVERFRNLRWLNLSVYRRADWVANGIVAMPFGFFLAGACDRKRATTLGYCFCLLALMLIGMAVVVTIEFWQIWYPPRTVSGNDIAAGCIGACLGPLSWILIGRPAYTAWRHIRALEWGGIHTPSIARWLVAMWTLLLVGYSVMPLDLMLSGQEWQAKWNEGRFAWIPEIEGLATHTAQTLATVMISLAVSAGRMVPIGFLASSCRMGRGALAWIIGLPVLIELLQAPIFTRFTTFADLFCGWGGGLLGMFLFQSRETWLRWNDRASVRVGVSMLAVGGAILIFLGRYVRWANDEEIRESWFNFWSPPFAKYYYTSEFLAGSNLVGKLMVFGGLGFVLANLFSRPSLRSQPVSALAMGLSAFALLTTGAVIEIGQVYLKPFYADGSDLFIYACGGLIGWVAYRTLVTWRRGVWSFAARVPTQERVDVS